MANFDKINLDHARKVYVVGDIHGCFYELETELAALDFDKKQDVLVSVGDLVDRGPESHLAVDYAEMPWFYFVRGNHEDMCRPEIAGTYHHLRNGGNWFTALDEDAQRKASRVLNSGPIILEVERKGKRFGFVHADFGTNDWNDAEVLAAEDSEALMWDRDRIGRAQHDETYQKFNQKPENNHHKPIRNIDHVFFGHTPLEKMLTRDNCSWIDTGAVFGVNARLAEHGDMGARFTIVDLDDYV